MYYQELGYILGYVDECILKEIMLILNLSQYLVKVTQMIESEKLFLLDEL